MTYIPRYIPFDVDGIRYQRPSNLMIFSTEDGAGPVFIRSMVEELEDDAFEGSSWRMRHSSIDICETCWLVLGAILNTNECDPCDHD